MRKQYLIVKILGIKHAASCSQIQCPHMIVKILGIKHAASCSQIQCPHMIVKTLGIKHAASCSQVQCPDHYNTTPHYKLNVKKISKSNADTKPE